MDSDEEQFTSLDHGWIVEQVERLKSWTKRSTGDVNNVSDSRPKIQRIPQHMAERVEFRKYYEPQIIPFGPFHLHKNDLLLQGKAYKDTWTAMYLEHNSYPGLHELYESIFYRKLVKLYQSQMDSGGYPLTEYLQYDKSQITYGASKYKLISWALVLDGCSVLQLLEKSDNSVDAEKELNISMDKLVRVHLDLLIMDNQIPFPLLRLLSNDDQRLEKCLHNFLQVHGIETEPKLLRKKRENEEVKLAVEGDYEEELEEPVHLLDYLRRALLMRDQHTFYKDINNKRTSLHLRKYRIGTILELKAAGIRVTKLSQNNSVFPSFKDGMLQLPQLTVDGSTAHVFLNLVAYEMCPDFRNHFEISSFLVFMSSLIDQPEDVKELRKAGIVINELASDKEVADLFNKMDTILVPETPLFAHIRDQIHSHFESKQGRIRMLSWMGEAYITFLRSPWTIIALLAATLGLVLTFIQTWFAVHPKAS